MNSLYRGNKVTVRFIKTKYECRRKLQSTTVKRNTKFESTGDSRSERLHTYIHYDKWEFGRVEKKLGKLHYLIKSDDARIWKRHTDQIRSIGENTPISVPKYTPVPVLCDNKATISTENNFNKYQSPEIQITPAVSENVSLPKLPNLAESIQVPSPAAEAQSWPNYFSKLRRSKQVIRFRLDF
ncbi:hypothetical protein QE152_g36762 [Popillia japonica]|uniref:Uncharacterized protein n=1 Tax=Popillia japonica TaxID=7064 RepID=A0AAW1IC33_POPJA